ncbi:hypothetical protein NDA11_005248 [Ustilago hordei]|nr:hypothetical protein NDA11_005248 [Ustilago hordei]KAJ1592192.1 hypothetical protein NDA12_006382 [Ustilago hordei]
MPAQKAVSEAVRGLLRYGSGRLCSTRSEVQHGQRCRPACESGGATSLEEKASAATTWHSHELGSTQNHSSFACALSTRTANIDPHGTCGTSEANQLNKLSWRSCEQD